MGVLGIGGVIGCCLGSALTWTYVREAGCIGWEVQVAVIPESRGGHPRSTPRAVPGARKSANARRYRTQRSWHVQMSLLGFVAAVAVLVYGLGSEGYTHTGYRTTGTTSRWQP